MWLIGQAGCLLIPIDMYHGDTKSLQQVLEESGIQLQSKDVVFHQNGEHLTNLWP